MKRLISVAFACGVAATPAFAAEDDYGLRLAKVGPTVSYVSLDNGQETVAFGALLDLGSFTRNWSLDVTADFWSKKQTGSGGYERTLRDVSAGARVLYHLPIENRRVDPAAGVGLAAHFLHTKLAGVPGFDGADDRTRLGFDVAGEVGFELGPHVDLIVQTVFRIVAEDSGFGSVDSFNQFYAGAGLLFGGARD